MPPHSDSAGGDPFLGPAYDNVVSEDPEEVFEVVPDKGGSFAAAKLRLRVLDLKDQGWREQDIAVMVGLKESKVARILAHEYRRVSKLRKKYATDLREREARRLDFLDLKLRARVDSGDVKAIEAALKVSEARRKLYGLDEPTKTLNVHDVDVQVHQLSDAEVLERLERLNITAGVDRAALPAGPLPGLPLLEEALVECEGPVPGHAGAPAADDPVEVAHAVHEDHAPPRHDGVVDLGPDGERG